MVGKTAASDQQGAASKVGQQPVVHLGDLRQPFKFASEFAGLTRNSNFDSGIIHDYKAVAFNQPLPLIFLGPGTSGASSQHRRSALERRVRFISAPQSSLPPPLISGENLSAGGAHSISSARARKVTRRKRSPRARHDS